MLQGTVWSWSLSTWPLPYCWKALAFGALTNSTLVSPLQGGSFTSSTLNINTQWQMTEHYVQIFCASGLHINKVKISVKSYPMVYISALYGIWGVFCIIISSSFFTQYSHSSHRISYHRVALQKTPCDPLTVRSREMFVSVYILPLPSDFHYQHGLAFTAHWKFLNKKTTANLKAKQ